MRRNWGKAAVLLLGGMMAISLPMTAMAGGPASVIIGEPSSSVINNQTEDSVPEATGPGMESQSPETPQTQPEVPPLPGDTTETDGLPDQTGGLTMLPPFSTEGRELDTSTQMGGHGITVKVTRGTGDQITNLNMTLDNMEGVSAIAYRTYVNSTYQNSGQYLRYLHNGNVSGGMEATTYVEAIQVQLTGDMASKYDVYYSSTVSGYGKLGYAKNGQLSGTMDIRQHIISIDVHLVPKGGEAPGPTENRYISPCLDRIHIEDGNTTYTNEDGTGYTGWLDYDYERYYFVNGKAMTGWNYVDGYKFYFAEDGKLVQDVDSLIGKQSSYQIHVNKTLNNMTIYAKDGDNGFVLPVKSCLTSVGDDTPIGTFYTPEKYRWRLMVNDTFTQYATRITKGFLIHSPTYWTQDNQDLNVDAYNGMGVNRSLGCVRVTTDHAKWIYDNCKIGTAVVVYEDGVKPGPFMKPDLVPVNTDTKYDPTDPAFF